MDAAAFPYSDSDIDWCWRARQAGWKSAVIQMKGVVHDNDQQASGWSATRVITFHRSRLRLLQRHLRSGGPLLKIGLLARHVFEFVALALGSPLLSNPKGSLMKRWVLITSVMQGYRV
jgi:GT2 family glycosyltransferase